MKVAALVIGILGALSASSLAGLGFLLGSFVSGMGGADGGLAKFMSVLLAVGSLVGAGIVMSKPIPGGAIMIGCAALILLIVGFNFLTFTTVILLGVAGALGLMAGQRPAPAIQPGRSSGTV